MSELVYLQTGQVAVGFEVNKKKHFCLLLKRGATIGDYATTFDYTSEFNYLAKTHCTGMFLRQVNLKQLL